MTRDKWGFRERGRVSAQDLIARHEQRQHAAAMNRLAAALERAAPKRITITTEKARRAAAKRAKHDPQKVAAAQEALAAVRESGNTPSVRNVVLMSERLKARVSRDTVKRYRAAGVLDF